jgi:hypothetical protein
MSPQKFVARLGHTRCPTQGTIDPAAQTGQISRQATAELLAALERIGSALAALER